MTLTEQKSGKQATDATTFDFRQKGGETSNAGNIAQNHLTAQGRRKKMRQTKQQQNANK